MNRVSNGFFPITMFVMVLTITIMRCNITTTTGDPEKLKWEPTITGTPETFTQGSGDDTSLKSLTMSGNGSWDHEFEPDKLNYALKVPNTVKSVRLTPNANSRKSKITINDKDCRGNEESVPIYLKVGTNEIAIRVTAENGDEKKYTLMVERLAPGVKNDDSYLKSLTLSGNGSWDSKFKSNVLNYTYKVPNDVKSITLTPNANYEKSKITINDEKYSSNEESEPISLSVGTNVINIQVTAENSDKRKYTIVVERLASGEKMSDDNSLTSLILSGNGSWDSKFKPNVLNYAYKVPNTVKSITITPNANSTKSKITVNNTECMGGEKSEPISLTVGTNEIAVQVTAENGDERKYTIIVKRLTAKDPIKVGKTTLICVGDSNCRRYPKGGQSFVTLLAEKLGIEYEVRNFGVDGATMVRGKRHYMEFAADSFKQIFKIKPDIITVMLGTNDAKPGCWKKNGKFYEEDAQAMVDTLLSISPKPRLMLVFPPKAFKNKYSISEDAITNEQVPILRAIAKKAGIETIDVNTPTDSSGYFADGVHLSIPGTELLAEIYYKSITK